VGDHVVSQRGDFAAILQLWLNKNHPAETQISLCLTCNSQTMIIAKSKSYFLGHPVNNS